MVEGAVRPGSRKGISVERFEIPLAGEPRCLRRWGRWGTGRRGACSTEYNIVSERDLVEAAGKLEGQFAEVETDRVKATSRQLSGFPKAEPS